MLVLQHEQIELPRLIVGLSVGLGQLNLELAAGRHSLRHFHFDLSASPLHHDNGAWPHPSRAFDHHVAVVGARVQLKLRFRLRLGLGLAVRSHVGKEQDGLGLVVPCTDLDIIFDRRDDEALHIHQVVHVVECDDLEGIIVVLLVHSAARTPLG